MSNKFSHALRKGLLGVLVVTALLVVVVKVRGFERTVEDLAGSWVNFSVGDAVSGEGNYSSEGAHKEWAIVLGASIRSEQFEERVARAAQLWQEGKVSKLLLSGDGRERFYNEPKAMKALLLEAGLPEEALVLDEGGLSTFSSMQRAAAIYGVEQAWVVTQDYHGPRAVYLAQHHGIEAGFASAAHPGNPEQDESRERKARVKAVLQVWGLAETTMNLMKEVSPQLEELAMM